MSGLVDVDVVTKQSVVRTRNNLNHIENYRDMLYAVSENSDGLYIETDNEYFIVTAVTGYNDTRPGVFIVKHYPSKNNLNKLITFNKAGKTDFEMLLDLPYPIVLGPNQRLAIEDDAYVAGDAVQYQMTYYRVIK